MKTPREILLARHRAAEPKLEALSRTLMGRLARTRPQPALGQVSLLRIFWQEVVQPAPRIWAGLAAVWVVILAAHVSFVASAPRTTAAISPNAAAYFLTLREQETWMAAATVSKQPAAEPAKPRRPQPRTELGNQFFRV